MYFTDLQAFEDILPIKMDISKTRKLINITILVEKIDWLG